MQISSVLFKTKQPLKNIRFIDEDKNGNNIIFISEDTKDDNQLIKFLSSQIKGYYNEITIPGIITNFLGKKLSSQKYFIHMKKELPNFKYNRLPTKGINEKTNIFDMSYIMPQILLLSKSRSKKLVHTEFMKFINSILKDYNDSSKNYLFINGSTKISSEQADYLNLLEYSFRLNGNKLSTELDGIVYVMNGKYYPLTISEIDKKKNKILKLNRMMFTLIQSNKDKLSIGEEEVELDNISNKETTLKASQKVIKEKIDKVLNNITDENNATSMNEIKDLVHSDDSLEGTFEEKLNKLYTKEAVEKDIIKAKEILELHDDVNDKYNGIVDLNIKQDGVFDMQAIVGLDSVSSYNKQYQELMVNMDEKMNTLFKSTLETDPTLNIKILDIKTKVVDDNKNRYKEYIVKIQHKDIGETSNKPYNISFRAPIVVQDKYVRVGGNNYVMISQMFPKPIIKVQANLVRLYTAFSVSGLELKNSILSVSNSFEDIETNMLSSLKSINKVSKLEEFTDADKDEIMIKYSIPDLEYFKHRKIVIKI